MGAVNAVQYIAPDGTEMSLRFTLGAQRRISEAFGNASIAEVLNKLGYMAVPRMLFYCAFDKDGNPPAGLTIEQFEESFPGGDAEGIKGFAALTSALTQGTVSKNELEAKILEAKEAGQTGLNSGVSGVNASGSQTQNSGTSTRTNLNLLRAGIPPANGSSITGRASRRQLSTTPRGRKRPPRT